MTTAQSVLSLFEEPQGERVDLQQIVKCDFCGEEITRALFPMNHGLIFNGWCIKAMMFHNRTHNHNPEELAWLEANGIDPEKSRFDKSHWQMENIAKWEAQ